MQRMKIEPDYVFQHDRYDEVLVLGVIQRYESYDTEKGTGVEGGVHVRYANHWDGYGPMFGSVRIDPIERFIEEVGDKLREFNRI